MNIQLSQIILIAAIVSLIFYIFNIRTVLIDRLIYLILIFGGIVFVISPELATWVANLIGVGRGADLMLYIFIIFSLFHHANNLSRVKHLEHRITILVRETAINTAYNNSGK